MRLYHSSTEEAQSYSVGDLAAQAGVSVRTRHHYDEIGLLLPSKRTAAGYRRYSASDGERLHRILVYRELGFDLAGIARILDDPTVEAIEHLRRQRSLLEHQVERLQRMIEGVEAMMNAKRTGLKLTPDEMREVFGSFDPAKHTEEVERRWGGTEAYAESQRRTSSYDKQQWLHIRDEAEQIATGLAAAMRDGEPPDSERAMDLAEQHRQHITRWFYDCSYTIHRGLGEMYVADPRFTATYDQQEPGLAAYIRDAISANAERAETP